MSYFDIYKKRMNRYGDNATDRLEKGRQQNFEKFLHQSPHYTKFQYKDKEVECVFEPSSQDETKTVMHVLCRVGEKFNPGDIVTICGKRYMFWYWDERQDSGYNRWNVIKLSQCIEWLNEDGSTWSNEAYIFSQQTNMLKNELKSRSRSATLYLENLKLDFMIMPSDKNLEIGSYLVIKIDDMSRAERVTGIDFLSTPGVMYVSMDPTIERDLTKTPEKTDEDEDNDFFWLGNLKGV